MKRLGVFFLGLTALFWCGGMAFAQQSAGVICNAKSALTNVRSGPTAKGTSIVASLPNNTSLVVKERVKNPEGTHDWARVEVRHEGSLKSGFVANDLISGTCSLPSPSSVASSSPASPASSSSPSDDPIGFKGCDGYRVPLAALTSGRRILNTPISASDIISTSCEKKNVTPFLGPVKTYYEMKFNLKTNRVTLFQGRPQTCFDSIVFRGEERGEGVGYLKGEVIVFSQSKAQEILNCDNPYFVQQERERASRNLAMLVYMLNGKIYYDKTVYEVAERDARQAAQRQREDAENAARNQFTSLIESQPDGQALYLLGGKFERENDTQKARAVYERLISKFASSEWAVKANDRLLAMRGEADANRRASDTQYELSRNREQAVRLCQNRRSACFSSCGNARTVSDRHNCESSCPLCN